MARETRIPTANVKQTPQTTEAKKSIIEQIKSSTAFKENMREYRAPFKVLLVIYRIFTLLFILLRFLLIKIAQILRTLLTGDRRVALVTLLVLAFFAWLVVDHFVYAGKIYPGVRIEGVDVGGKTSDEAINLIEWQLTNRLNSSPVIVYSSKEAQTEGTENNDLAAISEQISAEEQSQLIQYWQRNATDVGASLNPEQSVDNALNSTRGLQNIFLRLGALIFGRNEKAAVNYEDELIQNFNNEINKKLGTQMVNPSITFEGTTAKAKEGQDGKQVDVDQLKINLNNVFFIEDANSRNFVAEASDIKQQVSIDCANNLAQKINSVTAVPLTLNYKNNFKSVDRQTLCSWVSTRISEDNPKNANGCSCSNGNSSNYCMSAYVERNKFDSGILTLLNSAIQSSETEQTAVTFTNENGEITVNTNGNGQIPNFNEACNELNEKIFTDVVSYQADFANGKNTNDEQINFNLNPIELNIQTSNVPEKMSFDEAISTGLIGQISSYTTQYSTGSGTANRNHNIELVSSELNNSICKADGGVWSFINIVGDTTTDKGYLPAGSIAANGYTESVGGGVCQVATTVYNAVYDSGLPITTRYPHSLYISSYPLGRDAAINYPNLDLKWTNSLSSDVLVKVTSTGYSVTCTLIGISPYYTVETQKGEWEAGDHYTQEIVVDPSKAENSSYIQTTGTDGKSITIVRNVYDTNHKLIRSDTIKSTYKPKTEIRVIGPGEEANKLLAAKQARMKKDTDKW